MHAFLRRGLIGVSTTTVLAASVAAFPAAAHAATTCASDCVSFAGVVSSPEALRFDFTTSGLTRSTVTVRQPDGTSPVTAAGGAVWGTDFDIVVPRAAQGAVYPWTITATDISGNTWQESGYATTKVRTAKVSFTNLYLIDDSDPVSAGDILGAARCTSGAAPEEKWLPLSPLAVDDPQTEISSGTNKSLNATLTCSGVPKTVPVQTSLDDDDNTGFPYVVGWYPGGNASDYYFGTGTNCCNDWASTVEQVGDPIPDFGGGVTLPMAFSSYSPFYDNASGEANLRYRVDGTVTFSDLDPAGSKLGSSGPAHLPFTVTPGDASLHLAWDAKNLTVPNPYDYRVDYRPTGTASWTSVKTGLASGYTINGLTNGTTYDVQVALLDGSGLPYALTGGSGTPKGLAPSAITGWTTSAATLTYKSTVTDTVVVTAGGKPRGLVLQYQPAGTSTWTWYAGLVSDASGKATVTYPVLAGVTAWRIGAPATTDLALVISAPRTITAASAISGFSTTASTAKAGTVFYDSITVTPGAGRSLAVQYRKGGSSTWVTYQTLKASGSGIATVKLVAKTGAYAWRVSVAASPTYGAATTSGSRWITGT